MLFNSYAYLFFLPLVVTAYYASPQKLRWSVLFLASCYFYAAFIPGYIWILFGIILVDYCSALAIERTRSVVARKWCLVLSIVANLGVLGAFKYVPWFADITGASGWLPGDIRYDWVLPIGLSFHTFQSLSYIIEVYRGSFRAERHLGIYAVYVLFFPQLVAGPIERPQNIIPQLRVKVAFRYDNAVTGLRWILLGFLKKVVLADNLAPYVDAVFQAPASATAGTTVLAALFFTFQIYADFSGYSDIARGSAKVMGIDLMRNFDAPYLARSIREFWHRWHISLSTWFRDYVYIPMGGNRVGGIRKYGNIMAVFLLSGLWHGANWTFIVWGGIHGLLLCFHTYFAGTRLSGLRLPGMLSWALTFSLVSLSWIFFRANSISDAWLLLSKLTDRRAWQGFSLAELEAPAATQNILLLVFIAVLLCVERFGARIGSSRLWENVIFRWIVYYVAVGVFVVWGNFKGLQFVYFQF